MNLSFNTFHSVLGLVEEKQPTEPARNLVREFANEPIKRAKIIFEGYHYLRGHEFGAQLLKNDLLRLPHERCYFQLTYPDTHKVYGIFANQYAVNDTVRVDLIYLVKDRHHIDGWPLVHWCIGGTILSDDGLLWASPEDMPDDRAEDINDTINRLIAMLGFLNTKGVLLDHVDVKPAVNERRRAIGKQPLHPYSVVKIDPSILRISRNQGGEHASPIPHWRRGHVRRLPDRLTIVRPCIVNAKDEQLPPAPHYELTVSAV